MIWGLANHLIPTNHQKHLPLSEQRDEKYVGSSHYLGCGAEEDLGSNCKVNEANSSLTMILGDALLRKTF